MTEIYLHIDARMADYIRTHPILFKCTLKKVSIKEHCQPDIRAMHRKNSILALEHTLIIAMVPLEEQGADSSTAFSVRSVSI